MIYRDFEIRDLRLLAEEMADLAVRHSAEAERKDFASVELAREAFAHRDKARVSLRVHEEIEAELEQRTQSQEERKG